MLRRWVMGLLALTLFVLPAAAQTVDEVIAKNLEARGGLEKLKAVQGVRFIGKMTMGPGMEAPLVLEKARPHNMRLEFVFQGMTGVQAYDGKNGWTILPFHGQKDPEPMNAEDLKEAEEEADMDGPLVDYKAKGHTAELIGKEKVEGSDTYKIKVTLKNGDVQYTYLDVDSYLTIKEETKRTIRGSEMELESTLGDYKEVNGLLFPFSIQSGAKGHQEKQNIIVEKIELNPKIDTTRFKMPEAPKTEVPKAEPPKGQTAKPGDTRD